MGTLFFPDLQGISWPVTKSPSWEGSTLKSTSSSGVEYAISQWTYPRWKYSVSFDYLPLADVETMLGFFNSVYGGGDSWLFKDQNDYSVTGQTIAIGDGTTTQFQIVRARGGFVEPVLYVDSTSFLPKVYDNGVQLTTGYNVVHSGGILNFTSAPAARHTISMDYQYRWPCRFLSDSYDFDEFMSRIFSNNKLDFISQKRFP